MKAMLPLVAGLVGIWGCAGEPAQRIVVDRQALEETRAARATVDPPEERQMPQEAPPLARPTSATEFVGLVAVQPADLTTATSRASPSFVLGQRTEALERTLREPGRVVLREYPNGQEVPFHWSQGSEGYGAVTRQLLLVPERPLENRWYAIEVRVDGGVTGALRSDDVQLSRFRPDSHPVFQGVAWARRDDLYLLEARFSERVGTGVAASEWSIEDGEGSLPCTVNGPESGNEQARATWTCERAPVGHIRIDFRGVLNTIHGEPLRTIEGDTLTRVDVGDVSIAEPGEVTLLR